MNDVSSASGRPAARRANDFTARVDPELAAGLSYSAAFPPPTTGPELLDFRRRTQEVLPPLGAALGTTDWQEHTGPGVRLWSFTPAGAGPHPAIYWIHGGGMISGSLLGDAPYCAALAEATNCVVVAVDYRLAPEHPHPAPTEDAYAGLRWSLDHASDLNIDAKRVAVAGSSAGGGIAAAVALLCRDRGGPQLAFQYLMYPMLDDRQDSPSSLEFTRIPTWSREHNTFAWQCLLPGPIGPRKAGGYAAPARAANLQGLPPALIQVGELDLFRDEDIAYAGRLLQAGTSTELHVYPGAYHGFELVAPGAAVSRRALTDRNRALIRALRP